MLEGNLCFLLISFSLFSYTLENSFGGGTPLYDQNDKIVLLNNTNFQSTICSSSSAWIVEFYSSWCGHCIHFAPTFKEFANDVYPWKKVISVAAIDCAMEENMPTCREYEVMGYPTLKFFTPNTPKGEMGTERASRIKTVPAIKKDIIDFITDLQKNKSEKAGKNWPLLVPEKVQDLKINSFAILMVEEENSTLGSEVMLDLSESLDKLKVPLELRRIEINSDSVEFLNKMQVKNTSLVAIKRDFTVEDSFTGIASSRDAWVSAIKSFIWKKSGDLSANQNNDYIKKDDKKNLNTNLDSKSIKTASRKELLSRRYKVFTSDLEKAVLYSISHEVAQHMSISGKTLESLQQYVTVLEKYFPARIEMSIFLRDLHSWVHMHQDTIRGEDLSAWIDSYQGRHGIKANKEWIGCKGSETKFGGYPCGLWSVWHSLTINQANLAQGSPKEVLLSMQAFIEEFFGCRECARHFSQAIEGGKSIEGVTNYKEAILLLWKVHNKANQRLAGDISEDPVFPKLVFPSKEFCSTCYLPLTGSNLWDEFDKEKVLEFLMNLYSKEKLSHQGLSQDTTADGHALAVAPKAYASDNIETLDTSNFKREENATRFVFFNGADLSICVLLWFVSAVLLILIYLKFVSGKKFSNSQFFSKLKRKSSMNPLLGKV